jgi:hypothetical protein
MSEVHHPISLSLSDYLSRESNWSRFRTIVCLYFIVCVGWFAIRTAHWKQVNDPAQLHYLCFLMDHGMAPYRDLLEINMPGIYLVNWGVMHSLGGGSAAWRAFDFALMGTAAWAMIAIARPYEWVSGVFGATLFILFHGRDGAGQAGQRDFIIAVLLLCAYAFLFEAFRRRRIWLMFAFGLCTGTAGTIKPTPLPFALFLLALAAIRFRQEGESVRKALLYALTGFLTPLAIVGAFLISKHALGPFWYLLRVELPFYETLGRVPISTLMKLMATSSTRTLAILTLAIAAMKRDWWNWEGKLLVLGILFGVASYFGQGKGFAYHRYPMLGFLFLFAGLQIVTALRSHGRGRPFAIAGVTFVVILAPLYVREASRKVWDPKFADSLSADLTRLGGTQLSGHVQCFYTPADCDTVLYRMRLLQSTGLFYDYLIFGSPQQRVIHDLRGRFWPQFQNNMPEVVVVGSGLFPSDRGYAKLDSWPLFERELAANYHLYDDRSFPPAEAGRKAYRIYVKNNMLLASNQH